MKRFLCIALAVGLLIAGFLLWQGSSRHTEEVSYPVLSSFDWSTDRCYALDDFDSIVIDQSTLQDVTEIAPCNYMLATSYGGITYYPMEDGQWIAVRYIGPDLVVCEIEIVDKPS